MKRAFAPRRLLLVAIFGVTVVVGGCRRHAASAGDCRAILDRLVAIELKESGYHDQGLAPRWQGELARRFEADLHTCQGLRVRDDLSRCLAEARSSEEIAHRCLD